MKLVCSWKNRLFDITQLSKFFLLFVLLIASPAVWAQININSLTPYTQNFNTLPSASTAPWTDNATLTGWYSNDGTSTTISANEGSDLTNGLKSYGDINSSDRAIGYVGTQGGGVVSYGVRLKNNTGAAIRDFKISYTLEQ